MSIYIRNKVYTGPVQAVVLDWAGTALDYGCVGPMDVFVRVFTKHKVEVELSEVRPFMGLKKIEHVRSMLALPTVAEKYRQAYGNDPDEAAVNAIYADTEPMMVESVEHNCTLIPGLLEAISTLRAKGIKIGSCTGYTGPIMAALIPLAENQGYCPDCIVCSTDVPDGRPYPWMALQNAINLEVHPLESMVKVGDTLSDIEEGLNAGMWTVGFTQTGNELGLTQEQVEALSEDELASRLAPIEASFREGGAHYVVRGVWELPRVIEEINQRLSRGESPAPKA